RLIQRRKECFAEPLDEPLEHHAYLHTHGTYTHIPSPSLSLPLSRMEILQKSSSCKPCSRGSARGSKKRRLRLWMSHWESPICRNGLWRVGFARGSRGAASMHRCREAPHPLFEDSVYAHRCSEVGHGFQGPIITQFG